MTNPHNPVKASTGTPATPETLVREAFSVLDARGIEVSRSKVSRIARDYLRRTAGSGHPFERWLLDALVIDDLAGRLWYPDHTGNDAVASVLRGASR